MKRLILSSLVVGPAMLVAALAAPATVAAAGPCDSIVGANVSFNLWAKTGTLSLPTGNLPIWGYSTSSSGPASVPGPQLVVNQCDHVTVNLTNSLSQPTAILFAGQAMVPDQTGAAPAGTHVYTFTPGQPGTYLYEAGLIPGTQYQSAMGLHGSLIVRPAGAPGQAYGDAATAFDDEEVVVLEDIDPNLNNSTMPWTVDLRAYNPMWFLVNGRPYTSTAPLITTTAGDTLLLREVNAGVRHHSLATLGVRQSVLSADGSQLPAPRSVAAETLAPGQSADVLISIPVTTAASTKYAVYDAALALNNASANGIGGMLTFIDAGPLGSGGDVVGPTTSVVQLIETAPGSGIYTLTANESDAATGGANVAGAEYRVDATVGPATAMSASDGTFDEPDEAVTSASGAIDTTGWTSGTHTIYVRGQDALGNWGPTVSTTIVVDHAGPLTSALTLNPNPSNGGVNVTLSGSASDAGTGNSNVVAAEYFLGAPGGDGTGTPMTLNVVAPTVSLSATIFAPVASTTVWVHARDAANWGPVTSIVLTVDAAGPTTSALAATPPTNNGSIPFNSTTPFVRVTATISDAASGGSRIVAGEGFIDGPVVDGTGFPFLPVDGTFNSSSEAVYSDIPLSTINALSSGNHLIRVHGKDAVGNWGPAPIALDYLIDRTAPTFTSVSLAPNPTNGSTSVVLTMTGASDPLVAGLASGITGGEYWFGTTVPAVGSGTSFVGTSATIPVGSLATGTYTIGARIRDAAGNWSTVGTASLLVVPDPIFSNGFETGAVNSTWGWTSKSTNTASRLTVTTTAPMVGTRMLQAQGNNTNYVQYTFGTAAQPATATYDARFWFNPNNNASTGQSILTAGNSTFSSTYFHVRYRRNGTQPQVQIQVGNTANATWTNITNNAANAIEVTWQSGGSFQLTVNGTLAQTLTASSNSVGAVRLGSVTSGGSSTLEFFDAFASKRTVSPLFGP